MSNPTAQKNRLAHIEKRNKPDFSPSPIRSCSHLPNLPLKLFLFFIMRHPKAMEWENRLKTVFDEIDAELEQLYGDQFSLHPARRAEGTTSSPEMDGLFNVGASYSAGFGSKFGPGYVVDIRLSTLDRVPSELKTEIRDKVQAMLFEKLPIAFPGKNLQVDREHKHLRIHGNLSLD